MEASSAQMTIVYVKVTEIFAAQSPAFLSLEEAYWSWPLVELSRTDILRAGWRGGRTDPHSGSALKLGLVSPLELQS